MGKHQPPRLLIVVGLLLVTSVSAVLSDALCFAHFSKNEYPYCKQLSPEYALHWRVAGGLITFGIAVSGDYKMTGLGISEGGGVIGADIMLLHQQENGKWVVGDYFSENGTLTPDSPESQGWTLVGNDADDGGVRLLVVYRPLDTCDDSRDIVIHHDTDQTVIFAYGNEPGLFHGPRFGQVKLRLNPAPPPPATTTTGTQGGPLRALDPYPPANDGNVEQQQGAAQDLRDIMLAVPAFQLPSNASSSSALTVCTHLPLPSVLADLGKGNSSSTVSKSKAPGSQSPKFHIVRYQGLTGKGPALGAVHHMTLWGCRTQQPPAHLGSIGQCSGRPAGCDVPLAFWSHGVEVWEAPPEAGLPFGGPSSSDPSSPAPIHYVALQIQYSTPPDEQGPSKQKQGAVGFKVTYTPQLRPHDMGVLVLGSYDINLPSGQASFTVPENACPSSCTSRLPHSLTLHTSAFRMHKAGKSITTRHIRNGTEIQPLGQKRWWSPDHQGSTHVLPHSRTLLPGDTLATSCTYTTQGRTNTTEFGYLPNEEVCFNFLHYYPAVPGWSQCISLPGTQHKLAECGLTPQGGATAATAIQRLVSAAVSVALDAAQPPSNSSGAASAQQGAGQKDQQAEGVTSAILAVLRPQALVKNSHLVLEMLQRRRGLATITEAVAAMAQQHQGQSGSVGAVGAAHQQGLPASTKPQPAGQNRAGSSGNNQQASAAGAGADVELSVLLALKATVYGLMEDVALPQGVPGAFVPQFLSQLDYPALLTSLPVALVNPQADQVHTPYQPPCSGGRTPSNTGHDEQQPSSQDKAMQGPLPTSSQQQQGSSDQSTTEGTSHEVWGVALPRPDVLPGAWVAPVAGAVVLCMVVLVVIVMAVLRMRQAASPLPPLVCTGEVSPLLTPAGPLASPTSKGPGSTCSSPGLQQRHTSLTLTSHVSVGSGHSSSPHGSGDHTTNLIVSEFGYVNKFNAAENEDSKV